MERIPVSSSNISSVGYDPETRTLEVEFQGGSVYQYSDVPAEVHSGLIGAASVGAYLNANVKGRYSYTQV